MSGSNNNNDIFIVYLGDDDAVATSTPTSSPTPIPPERDSDFRKCPLPTNDAADGGDDDGETINSDNNNDSEVRQELWGVAPVNFIYSIQLEEMRTNSFAVAAPTTTLSENGESALLSSLSNAIINSIYENECATSSSSRNDDDVIDDDQNVRRNRRRLGSSLQQESDQSRQRRLGIQSISPGNGHRWRGECSDSTNDDDDDDISSSSTQMEIQNNSSSSTDLVKEYDVLLPSCNEVDGTVWVGFDTMGQDATFRSVGVTVLSRIQQDMANGVYLEQVNREMEAFNVRISTMNYVDSDYLSRAEQGAFAPLNSLDLAQSQSKLSMFSIISIPIIVFLFSMMLCFCWCSYSEYGKILRKRFAVFYHNADEDEDDFSDVQFEPYRKPKVVETSTLHQVEPKSNDLSRRSSYMDVPHCNKPQCRLCRHQSNHRSVSMIGELSKHLGGDEEDATCLDAQSLETTFHDLSEIKRKGYNEKAISRTETYSTVPHRSRSLFALSGNRTPSLIRIVAEDTHNKDGFYNEPDMVNFVKVEKDQKSCKPRKSNQQKEDEMQSSLPATTTWGMLSSWFGREHGSDAKSNRMDQLACGPGALRQVASDDRSDDKLDFQAVPVPRNSTMYSYTPSETKADPSRSAWSLPSGWIPSFVSTTKNNDSQELDDSFDSGSEQYIRRQYSLEDTVVVEDPAWLASLKNQDKVTATKKKRRKHKRNVPRRRERSMDEIRELPIQGARKRTLTDDRGRVRQEVSL